MMADRSDPTADAAFERAVIEDTAQRAPDRRLLDIHAVTVAGRPTPAQAVRIGDTIKLQADGRVYGRGSGVARCRRTRADYAKGGKTMKDGSLYERYTVTHKDGKPVDPTKRYFVLSPHSDPHARAALVTYVKACAATHPQLAADLREEYGLTGSMAEDARRIERALEDVRAWVAADIALAKVREQFREGGDGYDDGYYWDQLHGSESDDVEKLRLKAVSSFGAALQGVAPANEWAGTIYDTAP